MMTRTDFQRFAEMNYATRPYGFIGFRRDKRTAKDVAAKCVQWQNMVTAMADECGQINRSFDRGSFMVRSGMWSDKVYATREHKNAGFRGEQWSHLSGQ